MDRLSVNWKAIWTVALVGITVWVGFAAAAELCPQVHGPNDYCPVCHFVLIPFLQISVPVVGVPTLLVERMAPHPDSERDCSDYRAPGISRAPPSHS